MTQLGSDEVKETVFGETDVRKIEGSAKTTDSVLPEEFRCRANSKGIVPPSVVGCVARVLHRSEEHHKVLVRSKMRKFRDVLTQDDGTVGTSLGRTDANDERLSQKCTTSEHWQPGVFSSPQVCPGTVNSTPHTSLFSRVCAHV